MTQKTLGDYSSTGAECPTCGETFKGEHGVKIHHKRTHGETIRGTVVECDWCGDEYREHDSRIQERENLFCSRECMGNWRSENFVGENGTNYKGGGEERSCKNCGETFTVKRAIINGDYDRQNPTYCSNECQYEDLKTRYTGENNPRWKGGKTEDFEYGTGWSQRVSKHVKIRDQARCVDCGKPESETTTHGLYLDVHHICNVRESKNPAVYNAERNLATLCRECHQRWESHSPGLPPDITQHYESSRVRFERHAHRIR